MAPNPDYLGLGGNPPAFLARMMALPVFNDAVTLATQVYDNTKTNEVIGAAIRAAEVSMRVAATGALPLAAPLLHRVGGWEALDQWACRGLDQVEKVAPIIRKPTKEIVNQTRHRVLAAVAGDHLIVPHTFTDAVIARANRMIDAVKDSQSVRAAVDVAMGVADRSLVNADWLINTYLPPGRGDRRHSIVSGAGVRVRATTVVRKAGHRLYRSALRTMRPDLTCQQDAVITPSMVVDFTRSTAAGWYNEVLREPRAGEQEGVILMMARLPVSLSRDVFRRLHATLRKVMDGTASLSPTVQAHLDRARVAATGAVARVSPAIRNALNSIREIAVDFPSRLTPVIQDSIQTFRGTASRVSTNFMPMVQGSVEAVRTSVTTGFVKEMGVVVLDYTKYILQEARLWGKALFVVVQLSPSVLSNVSEMGRVILAHWLRNVVMAVEGSGRPNPQLYKQGLVPVKVTMMAPRPLQ